MTFGKMQSIKRKIMTKDIGIIKEKKQLKLLSLPWCKVSELPLANQAIIKQLSEEIFGLWMNPSLDEILLISSLDSSENLINQCKDEIKKRGEFISHAKLNEFKMFPGYEADADIWSLNELIFIIVSDFSGCYIYRGQALTSSEKLKKTNQKNISNDSVIWPLKQHS